MNQWKKDLSAFMEYVLWAILTMSTISNIKKAAFLKDMTEVFNGYKKVIDDFQFPIDLFRKKDPFKASREIASAKKTKWGG